MLLMNGIGTMFKVGKWYRYVCTYVMYKLLYYSNDVKEETI